MFLKSLTLKGFKSFADATTLELEPGVTVVVGPNGSGKSNVVDAIAWVLGAQAPSSVRSQKMDDVIFAGTATRPALGRAEVSLTIDNSAGILPIEFSEVTVKRTLFRTGDSEYAINDVPCRLLDVQELLSDAGVGRQQHVIVSQGQIDAVLNARPEDRRSIIEEAAGVLKYRKRKEKAERRLDATEANLLRVQDLLREVRRQLRPLERQAEAARRHGELIGELTGLRVYVAGREIAALRTKLTALAGTKLEAATTESSLKAELARLDAEVLAASAELTARGGDDVSDRLVRVEQLRERARGLAAVIVERRRGLERDRGQLLDADVVATLEGDAARYADELATVRVELAALHPETVDARGRGGRLRRPSARACWRCSSRHRRPARRAPWPRCAASCARGGPAPSGPRPSCSGPSPHRRAGPAHRRAAPAGRRAAARLPRLRAGRDAARRGAGAGRPPTAAELEAGHAACVAARQQAAEQASASAARVEALHLALDAARARAGAERLAGVDGVLGTLLDLVRIDQGWEAAVEAALGEALSAVVVDDPGAAPAGRSHALHGSDTTGAVLALGLPATSGRTPPTGGEPVRPHVAADRPSVAVLLDRLLAGATCVDDLDAAADGGRPGPRRRRRDRRRRPLRQLRLARRCCRRRVPPPPRWRRPRPAPHGVAAEVDRVRAPTCAAAAEALAAARRRVDDVVARRTANGSALTAAVGGARPRPGRAPGGRGRARAAAGPHRRADRSPRRRGASGSPSWSCCVPELEAGEAAEADAARARQRGPGRARRPRRACSPAAAATSTCARPGSPSGPSSCRTASTTPSAVWPPTPRPARDGGAAADRRRALARRPRPTRRARRRPPRRRRRPPRRARRAAPAPERAGPGAVGPPRRAAGRPHAPPSARSTRSASEPGAPRSTRPRPGCGWSRRSRCCATTSTSSPRRPRPAEAPPLPEGVSAQARVRELDRELRLLGPINPLALEEFTELQQRHAFLEEQLEDVRTTRRELNRVIRAVDDEIQTVFAAAYADVSDELHDPVRRRCSRAAAAGSCSPSPTTCSNTGIEVEAKPGGKNVKKLSLLSGGERSLTALAFLFAVFRSRPSPFYVMDEVEAALDDVNLHRFLGLDRRVPPRGPAARRQPPEAHDGGRRQPARRDDAARRLVQGHHRARGHLGLTPVEGLADRFPGRSAGHDGRHRSSGGR